MGVDPISDSEFSLVMRTFGYSEAERKAIDAWIRELDVEGKSAVQFREMCIEAGITALHQVDWSPEEVEGVEV